MATTTWPGTIHIEDGEPAPWVGQRMTLEQFLALPEVKPYLEYEDGIVRQKASPNFVHSTFERVLVALVNRIARPNRLGRALHELRFVSPNWAPVPDVSFYRRGRLTRRAMLANEEILIAPDLAIEVVSPSQSVTELIAKSKRYLSLGTTIALVIDPGQTVVMALRPDETILVLRDDERINLDEVLPGFEMTVSQLFDAIAADLDDDDEATDLTEAGTDDQTSSS